MTSALINRPTISNLEIIGKMNWGWRILSSQVCNIVYIRKVQICHLKGYSFCGMYVVLLNMYPEDMNTQKENVQGYFYLIK